MPTNDTPPKPVQMSLVDAPRQDAGKSPPVGEGIEVFGLRFKDENERRKHFNTLLAEKLKDPNFRNQPGFPAATDEDILGLSDPPWYTACPNPFLAEFISAAARPYRSGDGYEREPHAVDTRVGKSDALYKAHGYHTKVPHLAIVPSILHYTEPGDVVLDAFCGTGMTGVAAQWCGTAPREYRDAVEADWRAAGQPKPKWGARRAILSDISPAATFLAANYNLPFDAPEFAKKAEEILRELDSELGWMYETAHPGGGKGRINFTVWSEVFACPNCGGDVVFAREALNPATHRVEPKFPCPKCGAELGKGRRRRGDDDGDDDDMGSLRRSFQTTIDPGTGLPWKRIRLEPVLINYTFGGRAFEKSLDAADHATLARIAGLPFPKAVPTFPFPLERMYHGSRLGPKGFQRIHHLFLPRSAHALALLWTKANAVANPRIKRALRAVAHHQLVNASVMNRYRPASSFGNSPLGGVYYVSSLIAEASVGRLVAGTIARLSKLAMPAWRAFRTRDAAISTQSGIQLDLVGDSSVDYIFTDPPFGENIYYADLNLMEEAWHRVRTDTTTEAIVDRAKDKSVEEYRQLITAVFRQYHRVLKPSRWMTMVFSNSHNSVWNAIQEALGEAGFVVADVRTLDKKQRSFRQGTSSAVKEDLVVSCYKPSERLLQKLDQQDSSPDLAWLFVREHLGKTVVVVEDNDGLEVVAERTEDALFDRFVAFCVQRHIPVPVSKSEFIGGLGPRFSHREGMWFLPEQADSYDRKRMKYDGIGQLPLIVVDETSAIRWVRSVLSSKPQKFEDLQPDFMKQTQHWSKTEPVRDVREILEQNFLKFEDGEVPGPIHAYLSSNYHDLRSLPKDDPRLVALSVGRWYVPDPNRAGDLEKRRKAQLIKEFDAYVSDKRKRIDLVRREAVVAGFHESIARNQPARIIAVADKLPPKLLDDDFELYMMVENARTLVGD